MMEQNDGVVFFLKLSPSKTLMIMLLCATCVLHSFAIRNFKIFELKLLCRELIASLELIHIIWSISQNNMKK